VINHFHDRSNWKIELEAILRQSDEAKTEIETHCLRFAVDDDALHANGRSGL